MRHVETGRRARKRSGIFALVVLTSILSGCTPSFPIPLAPDGDPIEAARELPDAPDAVRNGEAGESCGSFALGQGAEVPSGAVEWLEAAVSARDAAELAWSFPTVEGDPIVNFVFVAGGTGEVTVYTTNAFDSYGGDPSWTKSLCTDVTTATSLTGCPPA